MFILYIITMNSYQIINIHRDVPSSIQNKIGEELNLCMHTSLTKEEVKYILEETESFCTQYKNCIISKFKEIYLLNVIEWCPYSGCFSRGSKSFYTLNLQTFKPTKNSQIQTKLSDDLIKEIKDHLKNTALTYHTTEKINNFLSKSKINNFLNI
jgi:hypothetical protein